MNPKLKSIFHSIIASDFSVFDWVEDIGIEGVVLIDPLNKEYWSNHCFRKTINKLDIDSFLNNYEGIRYKNNLPSLPQYYSNFKVKDSKNNIFFLEIEVKNISFENTNYHLLAVKMMSSTNAVQKPQKLNNLDLEIQYLNILNRASIGIVIHDQKKTYYVNDYLCDLLSTSREVLLKGDISRFISDEFIDQSQSKLDAIFNNQSASDSIQLVIKLGNGTHKNVLINGVQAKFNKKDVIVSYIFDTTTLEQIQNDLTASKEHFENIANNVPGLVLQYTLHPDGTDEATFISKGVEEVYGVSQEDALKDISTIWRQILPEHTEHLQNSIKNSAVNLTVWSDTWQIKRPDGQNRWVTSRGIPKRGNNGDIFWDTLIWDITEIKELDDSLTKTSDMLEQAGRLAKVGGWYFNLENNHLEWTNITREIHEVDDKYQINLDDAINFYPQGESRESLLKAIQNSRRYGDPYRLDVQFVTAKGKNRWVRTIGTPRIVHNKCVELFGSIQDITEQKENEILLIEQQRQLESINENISDGIYRANSKGLVYANKAFLKMFGYENLLDIIQNNDLNIYGDEEKRKELVQLILQNGIIENEEVTFIKKNKTKFIGLINARKFVNDKGEIFWDGAIRDITEEKRVNERIIENERLLKSINQNINDAIYRSELNEGLIYINDAFIKMFGFDSIDEILSAKAVKLYRYKNDRKRLGEMLIEEGQCDNIEVEFMRKDGSFFWGALNAIKVEAEDGHIYFDGAIRDISDQRATRNQIEYQDRMKQILMSISSKYINIPLNEIESSIQHSLSDIGQFVEADRAYIFDYDFSNETLTNTYEWCADGIKPEIENLQNLPFEIIPIVPEMHKQGKELIIDDVNNLEVGSGRDLLLDQNIMSLIALPMMQDKKCIGFVGFDFTRSLHEFSGKEQHLLRIFAEMLVNIKGRVQNQIELNHLLNTTSNQNKRLKEFAYIISHNIRSSVANLIGLTKIIISDPANHEYLRLLLKTSQKLDTSIKNINELLHFENDLSPESNKKCNIKKYILHNIQLHNQAIEKNEISINVNAEENVLINGVPAYLDSIFHNLISNAIKYGITRSKKQIDFTVKETDSEIIITVRDYGWGIDLAKNKEKLFKLGSRLHDSADGQGLGLYMTKHQVEAMNGTIDVQSQPNEGTAFIVHLSKDKEI